MAVGAGDSRRGKWQGETPPDEGGRCVREPRGCVISFRRPYRDRHAQTAFAS